MALPSITVDQQRAVNVQRRQGRTDRQIEKILGLRYGLLAAPYRVDGAPDVERQVAKAAQARRAEASEKEQRYWQALGRDDRQLRGWRPAGNCVTSRPNAAPLRSLPRNMNDRGNA